MVDVLLLIGLLVLAAFVLLSGPPAAEPGPGPMPAHRDIVGPMVERGMVDLNVFLERHSAFAAYLQERDASSGPPPE